MCLAIPMKTIELKDPISGTADFYTAVVDADGIQKEVRLDIVDSMPKVGDFLIVHAGFAIHTLNPEEAQINLELLQQMAAGFDRQP